MPERHHTDVATRRGDGVLTSPKRWITPVLLALVVAMFVLSMVLGGRHTAEGEEGFAGTDDAAAQAAEKAGAKPWIQPIFEPNSGEVESGLFALQAALGAGIVGYGLGRMAGRKKGREEALAAADLTGADEAAAAATPSTGAAVPAPSAETPEPRR